MTKTVCALALLLGASGLAQAEPVVTIRNNGPTENRLNMVIVGDGYTSGELVKYSTDVDLLVASMFTQSPYKEYERFFNILRVDVTSNQSGASHPENGVTRDTAFRSAYNCGGVQRLICANNTLVTQAVARSVPADARDLIVVLVNDPTYGGSGGSVVVASTHPQVVELVLHEMGHTLGLLGDEYVEPTVTCSAAEPAQPNLTRTIDRQSIKWAIWIDAATALPTLTTTAGMPGAYAGAGNCAAGLSRPTYDSKMRTLERPFEQINTEQLILRFYNFVAPYDSASPVETDVTRSCGDVVPFSVQPVRTASGELGVTWRVDGSTVATGDELRLDTNTLTVGAHSVEAEVHDSTSAVRRDPREALVERRRWNLVVAAVSHANILGFPETSRCQGSR